MRQFAGLLVAGWTLLYPADTFAETAAILSAKVAASLDEVLNFRDRHPQVRINSCQIEITEMFHDNCAFLGSAQGYRKMIDLSEVEKIEIKPFRDLFAIQVEFSVPDPNPIKFFIESLMLRQEEHFRRFSEEREKQIANTNLRSRETILMCSGAAIPQKPQSSIILFVERQPSEWAALHQLLAECDAP